MYVPNSSILNILLFEESAVVIRTLLESELITVVLSLFAKLIDLIIDSVIKTYLNKKTNVRKM